MNSTPAPRHSSLQAIDLELARLKLNREMRKRFDQAAELLALGQITVPDALEWILSTTAVEHENRLQEEERKKESQLLVLTKIEGIDTLLAEDLIDEFGSLQAIAQATPEKLEIVPGINKTRAKEIVKELPKLMGHM
jgi:NAD-dependent DNA ligase